MARFSNLLVNCAASVSMLISLSAAAQPTSVALAGLSYSGDAASLEKRFPYSRQLEILQANTGTRAFQHIQAALTNHPNKDLQFTAEQISDLKQSDQALVTTLVVNSETVSIERFGNLRKVFVLIRGQAIIFDFKSMSVMRSYPLSFAYIDAMERDPTSAEILDQVQKVYTGARGKPGIYARYAAILGQATVPSRTPRYLQVTDISISDDVKATLPEYLLNGPGVAETWAADIVSEAISTRTGAPIMPFAKGYAVGNVLSMRVADGSVFNLTLPKPDYAISVKLDRTKKVKFSENGVGASWIYGTFASIKVEQPLMGTVYMDTALKNGETKVVPATQTFVDDFPAFYDSWNNMFTKLALSVAGGDQTWVKSASKSTDIEEQIKKFNTLLQQCK